MFEFIGNIIETLITNRNAQTAPVAVSIATVTETAKPVTTRVRSVEVGAEIIGIKGGTKRNPITARFVVTAITFKSTPIREVGFSQIFNADAEAFVAVYVKELYADSPSVRLTLGEFIQWTRPCQNGRWA